MLSQISKVLAWNSKSFQKSLLSSFRNMTKLQIKHKKKT